MCTVSEKLLNDLSNEIFQKFIINKTVVGVQREDGPYIATKVPVTPLLIKKMLKTGAALGTYQQLTYSDMLRWICFDFDCKKDANGEIKGNVRELQEKYVIPFAKKLESSQIKYIVEFSGRRGFHIWVLLNQAITKNQGYQIVEKLLEDFLENEKYGVDRYPKSFSGKVKNKYGAMVKIPLSRHQMGHYSYFIENIFSNSCVMIDSFDESFLKKQLEYLKSCSANNPIELIKKINLEGDIVFNDEIAKKQFVNSENSISFEELACAFESDDALKIIWENIVNGCMSISDRKVMLGTFAHISDGEKILWQIFRMQQNFNSQITREEIQKNKKIYYPLTIKYLHNMYGVNPCDDQRSVAEFLLEKMGIPYDSYLVTEKNSSYLIEDVLKKECNYFHYNDEVLPIKIEQGFRFFSLYDVIESNRILKDIIDGNAKVPQKIENFSFLRKEEKKDRQMISLGVKERILTTALVFELVKRLQGDYKSYSYHLNLTEGGDVFFPWLNSWRNFIQDISPYFKLKIFDDFGFIKADLKSCYDSIFLGSLRNTLLKKNDQSKKSGKEVANICNYLISFNERLMIDVTKNPKGVPQGPAYARVLVEFILDSILDDFFDQNKIFAANIKVFRYVDDMYIFYDASIDGEMILRALATSFERYNLFFNKDKTKDWGKISELSVEKVEEFGNLNQLMYDVTQEKSILQDEDPCFAMDKFILRNGEWDINDANFLLSDCVDLSNRIEYAKEHLEQLVKSDMGRGSIFRKLYKLLFSDQRLFSLFIEKEYYKKIPINTVNFKNFAHILFSSIQKEIFLEKKAKQINSIVEYFCHVKGVDSSEKNIFSLLSK